MNVESYLLLSKTERQSHLDLVESCLERGGSSTNHRGVLAEYLKTDIYGKPADLCHACNNEKCSNPRHLYWGTRRENVLDAIQNGTYKSAWERSVEKYGLEEAKRRNGLGDKRSGGLANKGKTKSKEHKRKIAETLSNRKVLDKISSIG